MEKLKRAFAFLILALLVPLPCLASHLAPGIGVIFVTPFIVLSLAVNVISLFVASSIKPWANFVKALTFILNIIWVMICVLMLVECYGYFQEYSHWYIENLDPYQANSLRDEYADAVKSVLMYISIIIVSIGVISYNVIFHMRAKRRAAEATL